jgi:hypothetical protein
LSDFQLNLSIIIMERKHLKIAAGIACAFLAVVLVFRARRGADSPGIEKISEGSHRATGPVRNSKVGHERGASHSSVGSEVDAPKVTRSLNLPALPVDEKSLEESAEEAVAGTSGKIHTDDDILAMGGVMPVAAKPAASDDKTTCLKSIKSEDWKGAANLLVNALRAGEGFEVNHDQLMDFLRGKDLLGWPESYRNWIGDELMTALRQDMTDSAFADLKSIEADSTAPAAMRDYSVQHISHLVTGGVIDQEGVDFIWQALEKNDPQTLSTALISLHRLSEQKPDLVSAKQVQAVAERLKASPDERTRITAESILKTKPE